MKIRTLVTVAAATLVIGTAANAYVLFGPRWAVAQVPYYINPANGDGIPEASAIADIQAAADAWATQSNAAISMYYMGKTSGTTATLNGKNEVFFRNASKDAAAATTYWWSDSSNRLVEADVVIWDATYKFYAGSSGCSGGVYVRDVMTHEFGHALGIAHSSVSSATMYPVIKYCSTAFRSLDADDLAGIEALYPAGGTNTAPSITISAPTAGTSVVQGTAVTFAGTATDKEDCTISGSIAWRSNLDGAIGSGASFARALSAGSHTITATVTDSRGVSSTRQTTVTVTEAATQPAPEPSSPIGLSARPQKVKGNQQADLWWSGATTSSVNIFRNGVKVLTVPNSGSAVDAINKKGGGTYTYRLCEVGTSVCSRDVTVVF